MSKTFREKWLEAVENKNSVLCAGLDPAETSMGRGKKGLFHLTPKHVYATGFLEAVAPYCAALKPNTQYWRNDDDRAFLEKLIARAHGLGLVVIDDAKLADIGSTNDAGFFNIARMGFDACTVAPYAGNIAEAAEQAHARGIGAITMCLMSNPEYSVEKNALMPVVDDAGYQPGDLIEVPGQDGLYVRRYVKLAHDAQSSGIDGIVIGAPSAKNHLTESELVRVRSYVSDDMLVLMPGVGAQGGEAEAIWQHFNPKNVIVNVGRALMFPDGNNDPVPKELAAKAEFYRDLLNEKRRSA